jgi:hypothetical protein
MKRLEVVSEESLFDAAVRRPHLALNEVEAIDHLDERRELDFELSDPAAVGAEELGRVLFFLRSSFEQHL